MIVNSLSAACLLSLLVGSSVCASELDPYRLNPAVQPLKQQLEMTIDPNRPDYVGSTHIVLEVREAVESVVLHAQDITILGATFGPEGAPASAAFERLEQSMLHISTGSTIEPGEYELHSTSKIASIPTVSACIALKRTTDTTSLLNWKRLKLGRRFLASTSQRTSFRGRLL